MDVFLVDGVFDDFPGAEGDVSGGVEIGGSVVDGSLSCSPLFNFGDLGYEVCTLLVLSCSETLTILPKEGITLMLILS